VAPRSSPLTAHRRPRRTPGSTSPADRLPIYIAAVIFAVCAFLTVAVVYGARHHNRPPAKVEKVEKVERLEPPVIEWPQEPQITEPEREPPAVTNPSIEKPKPKAKPKGKKSKKKAKPKPKPKAEEEVEQTWPAEQPCIWRYIFGKLWVCEPIKD
jgi:outer membrane biosynthesis protein TonB